VELAMGAEREPVTLDAAEMENTEETEETESRLLFRIEYKRLHERERRRTDNTQKKALLIYYPYPYSYSYTYSYSYSHVYSYYSHATEPNTNEPSSIPVFQTQLSNRRTKPNPSECRAAVPDLRRKPSDRRANFACDRHFTIK
jgi:hypothetical protein